MTYDIQEVSKAEFEAGGSLPYELWFFVDGKMYRARFGEFGTLPPEFDCLYERVEAHRREALHLPDGGEEMETVYLATDVEGERDHYERQVNYGPWRKVGTLPSPLAKYRERRAAIEKAGALPSSSAVPQPA